MAAISVIVTFILAYLNIPWADPSFKSTKDLLMMAVGLVTGASFFIIGFTYDVHNRLDEYSGVLSNTGKHFQTTLKDAVDRFDSAVDCRYIGLGSKTLNQVLERLESAQTVRNTFVLFGIAEKDAYPNEQFKQVGKIIKPFLKRGGNWTDIISQDVVNSPTKKWLEFLDELIEESEKGNEKDLAKAAIERYKVRHLKGIYPLINFIILQYSDGSEEVIFGWGHHSEEPSGRVFLSRNKRLIATFDQYWKILEKDSTLVDWQKRPITPTEITGLWFRVSYYLTRDWKARAGVPFPEANGDPNDMALVKISIKENRNLVVEGRRFRFFEGIPPEKTEEKEPEAQPRKAGTQGKCIKRINSFDSKAVDLEESRLWFSTTSGHDEKLHIAGWYRFVIDPKKDDPKDVRIEQFYGEFVEYKELEKSTTKEPEKSMPKADDASPFEYQVGRLVLYGRKLPSKGLKHYKKTSESPEEDDFLDDFPNAPKDQIALIRDCLKWWDEEGKRNWQYACLDIDNKSNASADANHAATNVKEIDTSQ